MVIFLLKGLLAGAPDLALAGLGPKYEYDDNYDYHYDYDYDDSYDYDCDYN